MNEVNLSFLTLLSPQHIIYIDVFGEDGVIKVITLTSNVRGNSHLEFKWAGLLVVLCQSRTHFSLLQYLLQSSKILSSFQLNEEMMKEFVLIHQNIYPRF